MGAPSMNFIRKLYNKINYRQEQLDEIINTEEIVAKEFNGDIDEAFKAVSTGICQSLSSSQLEELKKKEWVETNIQGHIGIFNMYKQFHRSPSDSES